MQRRVGFRNHARPTKFTKRILTHVEEQCATDKNDDGMFNCPSNCQFCKVFSETMVMLSIYHKYLSNATKKVMHSKADY